MEQSGLLLEQRKDVVKTSNQQDQTSLLEAEQDKVGKSRGNLLHSHSAGEGESLICTHT
jgi:hypothetical protein